MPRSDGVPFMHELPCFKCGKPTKPEMPLTGSPFDSESPPSSALLFHSYGNYGSTVFDSVMGGEYLLIIICDECAVAAGKAGIVLYCTRARVVPQSPVRELWRPEEDD